MSKGKRVGRKIMNGPKRPTLFDDQFDLVNRQREKTVSQNRSLPPRNDYLDY